MIENDIFVYGWIFSPRSQSLSKTYKNIKQETISGNGVKQPIFTVLF